MIKKFRPFIAWIIIAITAYFFAKSLANNWESIKDISLKPDIWIILSLIFFVVSVVSSGWLWGKIVSSLVDRKVSNKEAIRVHLASWLFKYIPGQAGSLINKISWGRKKGYDGKKITASFIYENVYLLLASTVPTIPILFVTHRSQFSEKGNLFVPLLVAVPFVLIVLSPWFFTRTINLVFRFAKKQKLKQSEMLKEKDNVKYFLLFIIPRIFNGLAFVFIAESLVGIPLGQYAAFSSLYVLAGIVGVLAIFVPSGLGVREAVIVLFASNYVSTEQAILLALVSRFYATLADVMVAALYLVLKPKKELISA